jgi:hypothetical protein
MLALLTVCLIGLQKSAAAQQAIVNLPSADITPKGQHFLMHEMQTRPFGDNRFWYGTNFYCYGVGKNTELAVTTYNSGTPQALNENVGVGFKTAVPLFAGSHPNREIKWTFGKMTTYSLRGRGMGGFVYTHGSFRLPKLQTRLTAGVSGGSRTLFKKNTVHAITGFEHPIIKHRLYAIGEWFSGRHDFGFFTPGVLFHPKTERQVIVVAYKIANNRANGANGLVFEYGMFLGGKKSEKREPSDHAALRRMRIEETETRLTALRQAAQESARPKAAKNADFAETAHAGSGDGETLSVGEE